MSTDLKRFVPVHPAGQPVNAELLNTHTRFLVDQMDDARTAALTVARNLVSGTAPVTVPPSGGVSVFVVFNRPFSNTHYLAFASVEGAFLQVADVQRFTNQLRVFVLNRSGGGSSSGTVMVLAYPIL